jgi:hypothetical protein
MSQLPRRPVMIDPTTGLPYPMDPGVDPTMGMPSPPPAQQPGFMSKITQALGGPQGMMNLGASLMAGSGPSPVKQNFGSILGQSLLQNQQFQQQQGDSELKKALLMSQIERNKRGTTVKTPSKVQEYEYAKQNGFKGSFQEWMRVGSAQQSPPSAVQEYEYYNNLPDQQAKDTYLTIKRSMQPFQLGEVGGGKVVFNRATGQYEQASSAEQEAAGAGQLASGTAAGKATGEAVATAKLDLPRLEQNTTQALQTIDQLKKHPGLPYITGLYSAAPILPGTPQAGADALAKQIQGKTFLEAFTTLKGGGAITEIEGGKAEAAIARLQRSQNRREYIQALTELEGVMNVGLERARKKANAGAAPRSREDILKQYGVQ